MAAKPAQKMRFLVFGAGAIGTYIGGSLALAGYPVVFVEREELCAELASRGLRLRAGDTDRVLTGPQVVGSTREALALGPFEAGILAVKSYDTQALATSLSPFSKALPPLVDFQNGVENEAVLAKALGREKVVAGTVTTAIRRSGPGEVVVEKLRGVGLEADHPLSKPLKAALASARLNPRLYPDARGMKWSKLLTNLIANASSAILDMTPAEIFADPRLFQVEQAQLREALRVMTLLRIPITDLPGTPVRLLAAGVWALPAGLARPLLEKAVGSGRGGKMPSFHIDLHTGRGQSEVGYLNGAVYRAALKAGLTAPVNRTLTETLEALVAGRIPLETYAHQPDAFLDLFKSIRVA